jgi:hypothetical protein
MIDGHGNVGGNCGINGHITCPEPVATAGSAYVATASAPVLGQVGNVEITMPVSKKLAERLKK